MCGNWQAGANCEAFGAEPNPAVHCMVNLESKFNTLEIHDNTLAPPQKIRTHVSPDLSELTTILDEVINIKPACFISFHEMFPT